MTPFKTPYEKSTTASRRAQARSQMKFSHVSLVYDKHGEKQTQTKVLMNDERYDRHARTKHGRRELDKLYAAGGVE